MTAMALMGLLGCGIEAGVEHEPSGLMRARKFWLNGVVCAGFSRPVSGGVQRLDLGEIAADEELPVSAAAPGSRRCCWGSG